MGIVKNFLQNRRHTPFGEKFLCNKVRCSREKKGRISSKGFKSNRKVERHYLYIDSSTAQCLSVQIISEAISAVERIPRSGDNHEDFHIDLSLYGVAKIYFSLIRMVKKSELPLILSAKNTSVTSPL